MDGYELTVDTTALEKANKTIEKMVNNVELLRTNMREAFARFDVGKIGMALGSLQSYIDKLSKTKVTPEMDTKSIEHYTDAINEVVQSMSSMAKHTSEMFDTRKIYETGDSIWDIAKRISDIKKAMKDLRQEVEDAPLKGYQAPEFNPVSKKDGKPLKEGSRTYNDRRKEYLAQVEQEKALYEKAHENETKEILKDIEIERRALQEKLRIQQEYLKMAFMTAAEKTEYVQKLIDKETKAEQKKINTIRSDYEKYLTELRSVDKDLIGLEGKNTTGQYSKQIDELEARYKKLYENKATLEDQYGHLLVDIAEKHNAKMQTLDAKRIDERIKKEKEAIEAQRATPKGALNYAASAKTINEMKQAQKYLLEARGNADASDTQTIKNLNDAYTKLRMTIESLTTAEKNENALQPTLRNEYARLLVELDKLNKAEERLKNTNALKNDDASAQQELVALMQRRTDVTKKMEEIEKAAQPNLQRKKELEAQLTAELQKQAQLKKGLSQRDISRAEAGKGPQQAKDYVASIELTNRLQAEIEAEDKKESAIADVKRKHRAQQAMEEIANIEKIEAEKRRLATISADEANRLIKEVSNDKNVANIKQEEVAIEKLTDARNSLDKNSKGYDSTLKSLNDEIEKHTHQLKLATDASYRKKEADKTNSTYEGAKAYREQARSIQELIRSIEYMKTARKNLDIVKDKDKIDELNKSIRRTQREVNRLEEDFKNFNSKAGNLFGQLARRMAALYSVSAIEGYVKKVAEVRGEFEMQQKSLQLLVGNVEEANKIWDKTIAMAVKSPFKVRELVTYTKQLSAYRIETEKLYDTTKMLADVSAGLGVDMDRLILAYGQVKAANYLRGTELRQFSEAGVNMLEELAKQFSAVEGKAVSVGQVFDRISKRMVTFEHVNQVFENITGEGGAFYQMQEKQSETLKGMLMNFQDSMDLMLNDIGKENEETLKTSVKLAKTLVDSWRAIAPLMSVCSSIALVYAAHLVKAKLAAISLAATMRAIKSLGVGSWATIALGVVYAIYQAKDAMNQFKHELQAVDRELTTELAQQINLYIKLANTINDVTKTEVERKDALNELKVKFNDILPDQYLQLKYIKQMSIGYKEAEEAMISFYDNESRKRKLSLIEQKKGSDIQTQIEDIYIDLIDAVDYAEKQFPNYQKSAARLRTLIPNAVQQLADEMKMGMRPNSDFTTQLTEIIKTQAEGHSEIIELWEEMLDPTNSIFDINAYGTVFNHTQFNNNISQLTSSINEYQTAVSSIQGLPYSNINITEANTALAEEKEKIDATVESYKNLIEMYKQRRQAEVAVKQAQEKNEPLSESQPTPEDYDKHISEFISEAEKQTGRFHGVLTRLNEGLKNAQGDLSEIIQEGNRGMVMLYSQSAKIIEKIGNERANMLEWHNRQTMGDTFNTYAKKLQNTANNLDATPTYKAMMNIITTIVDNYNLPLEKFASIIPSANATVEETAKKAADSAELTKKAADEIMSAHKNRPSWVGEWAVDAAKGTKEMAQESYVLAEVLDLIARTLGNLTKTTGGGAQKDWFSEIGKSIRDTHKDFLTLHQDLNKADALYWAIEKHKDVFKEAAKNAGLKGLDLESFTNYENAGDAIEGLEALLDLIPEKNKTARLSIQKMIGELTGEDNVRKAEEAMKRISDAIDKAFDTYEISIELDKMGVSPEIANQLFGIESIDLSDLRQQIVDKFNLKDAFGDNLSAGLDTASIVKYAEQVGLAKEQVDALRDSLQKIDEKEDKELLERQQKYLNFLVDQQGKRVKILVQEMRDIEDIQKTFTLTDKKGAQFGLTKDQTSMLNHLFITNEDLLETQIQQLGLDKEKTAQLIEQYQLLKAQKDLALSGVEHTTQEALDKQTWEDFKQSGYYEEMFTDLDNVSNRVLVKLEEKLTDLRSKLGQLPPQAAKEVQSAIDKIEAIKMERNPFKEALNAAKELQELNSKGITISTGTFKGRKEIENELFAQREKQELLKQEIDTGKSLLTLDEGQRRLALDKLAAEGKSVTYQDMSLEQITETVTKKEKEKKLTDQNVDALQDGVNKYNTISDKQKKMANTVSAWSDALGNALGSVDQLLEALGEGEDSVTRAMLQAGQAMTEMISQMANLATASNTALGVIGMIAAAVQAVAKIITIFSALHDAKLQVEIDKQAAAVEKLEKAYERLQKQMEAVYNIADIQHITAERQKNSEEQIASYERMIELEEQKKDSDAEKIKEWREAIEEEKEAMLEAERERKEALGGFGNQEDYKEASTAFVEAWLDAYKETGNGLKGLHEQFDEFFADMVQKQLLNKGVESIMAPFYEEWNSKLSDGDISDQDAAELKALKEEYMNKLDKFLTVSAEQLDLDTDNVGELGTLQKGIQGITEDQADVLASYLNSIRFFVAEQTDYLKMMALGNQEATESSTQTLAMATDFDQQNAPNPMLDQLKLIADNTTSIRTLLDGLLSPHNQGGMGLKVIC